MGGKTIAIPDPLPQLRHQPIRASAQKASFEIFFICSWAADEPIAQVLQAAQLLQETQSDIVISFSGRPRLEKIGWFGPIPDNTKLLGYLSEKDFESKLMQSDLILDFTTRDDCMVCGAYEATSAEVPMILSDNAPTKSYFNKGAFFTDNSAGNIAQLIEEARRRHSDLKQEIVQLKHEILEYERSSLQALMKAAAGA
jgi:hypothetical protein